METKKEESCIGCDIHKIINDRDPFDSFNDDDVAVVCTLTINDKKDVNSKYLSDRQEFKCITNSCRPYNIIKESRIPNWCPKKQKDYFITENI